MTIHHGAHDTHSGENREQQRHQGQCLLFMVGTIVLARAPLVASFGTLSCQHLKIQNHSPWRPLSFSVEAKSHGRFHAKMGKGWIFSRRRLSSPLASSNSSSSSSDTDANLAELKAQLTLYLKKREEQERTETASKKDSPDVFDYGELIKYGYGKLVQPIMDNGGRGAMYRLMEMTPPPSMQFGNRQSSDRLLLEEEEADDARFGGLNAAMDDESIGRALEEAQQRSREEGGPIRRKKLREEEFVRGSARTGVTKSSMTPAWTPERMDEEARRAGQRYSWARRVREEEIEKRDKDENILVEGGLRWYSALVVMVVSLAFGQSTPTALTFLEQKGLARNLQSVQETGQFLALSLLLGAVGSSIVASVVLAPQKNRSSVVWAIKGLLGGPLAIVKLRELTVIEEEKATE